MNDSKDQSKISKRALKVGIQYFVLTIFGAILFLGGAFVEWKTGDVSRYAKAFFSSSVSSQSGPIMRKVDQVLVDVITKSPPAYSFVNFDDFEVFKLSFDSVKFEALGFPLEEHRSFLEKQAKHRADLRIIKKESSTSPYGGVIVEKVDFPVIGDFLPGLIVRRENISPDNSNVILLIPGHPSGKANGEPLNDLIDKNSYQKGLAIELAENGYVVFCMGLRGFSTDSDLDSVGFEAIASMKSYSWYGFLTSDALLIAQTIAHECEIDRDSIGIVGLSTGGGVAMFASSFEKFSWAIVAGFFGSFSHNFVHEIHSYSGNINGILKYVEMADFVIASLPQRIAIINGKYDTFGYENAQYHYELVRKVYSEYGHYDSISFHVPDVGHEYDVELILRLVAEFEKL